MKSRLVIFDAVIIIAAFEGDFWNSLVSQFKIHVPSIVLREATHYRDKNRQRIAIDMQTYVQQGKVIELTATAREIQTLQEKVNPNFMDRIDDGELEALALLMSGKYNDYRFCTSDTRAIKSMSSLSLGAFGVSLEELLDEIKLRKKLPDPSYSKAAFDRKKAEGLQEQDAFIRKKK